MKRLVRITVVTEYEVEFDERSTVSISDAKSQAERLLDDNELSPQWRDVSIIGWEEELCPVCEESHFEPCPERAA